MLSFNYVPLDVFHYTTHCRL